MRSIQILSNPLHVQLNRESIKVVGYLDNINYTRSAEVETPRGLVNGFKHPRVLVADFDDALIAITRAMKEVRSLTKKICLFPPVILIQVTEFLEGGITFMEKRALTEMFERLARRVVIVGETQEISNQKFLKLISMV